MTNTLNTPAEAIEMQYPLRVRVFRRANETGGHGRHRGGDGIYREIEATEPCEGTLLGDRRRRAPYGLAGARDGARAEDWIRRNVPRRDDVFRSGKAKLTLAPGDRLCIRTPGGGGHGNNDTSV
jgi:N-methylhydantoinase B